MDTEKYFESLTQELFSLKDRVRLYIQQAHPLSDGEWKETVIRTVLRRHLPVHVGVGHGFVVSSSSQSKQIDILLYDKTKPILFQDGEFLIVTPDTVKGAIEVKTSAQSSELETNLETLCNNAEFIQRSDVSNAPRFFGFFSYEDRLGEEIMPILEKLRSVVGSDWKRTIHCLSFGTSRFIRFWEFHPSGQPRRTVNRWHGYHLENKAPAYFIHNVIDHLNPVWANANNDLWYPSRTKEPDKVGEIDRIGLDSN